MAFVRMALNEYLSVLNLPLLNQSTSTCAVLAPFLSPVSVWTKLSSLLLFGNMKKS